MSESDLWEGFFSAAIQRVSDSLDKRAKSLWQPFEWRKAAQIYRQKVLDWYGTTRILGKPDPVPLDNIFTDVLIWDKPQQVRIITAEALQEAFQQGNTHKELERMDGLEALEQFPRLFILGKPGAGKTTFLKWVALLQAQEYQTSKAIPIFISLKEMADAGRTLQEQILFAFEACHFPNANAFIEALLTKGNALLLLDGLDEVQAESGVQDKIINDIRDFVRRYDKNRFLITCRVAAVSYEFESFKYVEMADFTDDQIETYISRYFINDAETGQACWAELNKPDHKGLREISGSPLLLSLLCLNYEESGTFPARRVDLYEDALKALLTKWDGSRRIRRDEPYKQLPIGRKPQLYAQIAYDNFVQGKYFITTRELAQQVEVYLRTVPGIEEPDGEIVLKAMEAQHGIIVERARQVHGFAHLTFQEYYTAKYIVDNQEKGTLDELMKYITDAKWREVFLLTVSLLPNADTFFHKFFTALGNYVHNDTRIMNLLVYSQARTKYYQNRDVLESRWWSVFLSTYFSNVIGELGDFIHDVAPQLEKIKYYSKGVSSVSGSLFRIASILKFTFNPEIAFALAHALFNSLGLIWAYSAKQRFDETQYFKIFDNFYNKALAQDFILVQLEEQIDIGLFVLMQPLSNETRDIYMDIVLSASRELRLQDLEISLRDISHSINSKMSNSYTDEQNVRQIISKIAIKYRGLEFNWNFSQVQIKILEDYLIATVLVVECLDLAVVSDREGIKAQLLMPSTNVDG